MLDPCDEQPAPEFLNARSEHLDQGPLEVPLELGLSLALPLLPAKGVSHVGCTSR